MRVTTASFSNPAHRVDDIDTVVYHKQFLGRTIVALWLRGEGNDGFSHLDGSPFGLEIV